MSNEMTGRGRPIPRVYGADGRLLDPYHVLDASLPHPARRAGWWTQRQLDLAASDRELRAGIFAAEAALDPADHSLAAEHLREVAGSERDHADAEARRAEWAAAALQADPSLAERMHPVVAHDAHALLTTQATTQATATTSDTTDAADDAPTDTTSDAAGEEQLWAEHDRDLAIAARLEGPGIDDITDLDQAHDLADTAAESAEAADTVPAVDLTVELADEDGDDFGA